MAFSSARSPSNVTRNQVPMVTLLASSVIDSISLTLSQSYVHRVSNHLVQHGTQLALMCRRGDTVGHVREHPLLVAIGLFGQPGDRRGVTVDHEPHQARIRILGQFSRPRRWQVASGATAEVPRAPERAVAVGE